MLLLLLLLLVPIPASTTLLPPASCAPSPPEFCATSAERFRISERPSLDASEIESVRLHERDFHFPRPQSIELGQLLLEAKLHLPHHEQLGLEARQFLAVLLTEIRLAERLFQLVPQIEQITLSLLELLVHLAPLRRLVLDRDLQCLDLQLQLFAPFLLLVERFLPADALARCLQQLRVCLAPHRAQFRVEGRDFARQPCHLILERFVVLLERTDFTAFAQQTAVTLGVNFPPMPLVLQLQMQQSDVVLVVGFGQSGGSVPAATVVHQRGTRFGARFYVLIEQGVRIEPRTGRLLRLVMLLQLGETDAVEDLLVRLRPANDRLRRRRDGGLRRNGRGGRNQGRTALGALQKVMVLLVMMVIVMGAMLQMTDRCHDGGQIVAQLPEQLLVACELLARPLLLLACVDAEMASSSDGELSALLPTPSDDDALFPPAPPTPFVVSAGRRGFTIDTESSSSFGFTFSANCFRSGRELRRWCPPGKSGPTCCWLWSGLDGTLLLVVDVADATVVIVVVVVVVAVAPVSDSCNSDWFRSLTTCSSFLEVTTVNGYS
uniref:Secreted protein n=1 Tax=Anopheles farauti TaxID=69004 RepID=A0A182QTS8_9DIPT